MKHSRDDYKRIQDPAGLIPEDEPVFLLRAQDIAAPFAVRSWAQRVDQLNGDKRLVHAAMAFADEMETWPDRKMPDLPGPEAAVPPAAPPVDVGKETKPDPLPPADPDKEPKPDPPVEP